MRARVGALLLLAVLAGGCRLDTTAIFGKPMPARGGQVTEAVVGSIGALNPLFVREENARDIDSLIYQGLTGIGPDQDVVGVLAKGWTVSPDGLTYRFLLRDGIRWADGQPLTTDDVLFTYSVLQDPAYNEPGAAFWKQVQVALDGDAIKFTLKSPSASFPLALDVGIIPHHVFSGAAGPAAIASDPHSGPSAFGTGPFQVDSISRDRRTFTLRRNPNAASPPMLDRIVFRSYPTLTDATEGLLANQADALGGLQPPQLQAIATRPDLEVHSIRTYSFVAALFSLGSENAAVLEPAAVRQAIVQAVDRKAIVQEVLRGKGEVAPGPIPPSNWAYDPRVADRVAYDPKAAAAALDAAGWTVPAGGGIRVKGDRRLSLELVTADAYPYLQVAETMAAQARSAGVELKVTPVPASTLVSDRLVGRRFQMAVAAFDNGPDPDQFALWHSGQPASDVNFGDTLPRQALIDKDLEDGRASTDRSRRRAAYVDFQNLLADAAAGVFVYQPDYLYAVARRVRGFKTNAVIEPVQRLEYVSNWYVMTRVR